MLKNNQRKPGIEMEKFTEGALTALSVMNSLFDRPSMCANVVLEMGIDGTDCSGMDDFDKRNMRLINENLPDGRKIIGLEDEG